MGPAPSTSRRPVIPNRRPIVAASVSSRRSFPTRRVPVTVAPRSVRRSAAAVVPPLRYQASGACDPNDAAADGALRDAPVVLHLDHLGHGLTQWQT